MFPVRRIKREIERAVSRPCDINSAIIGAAALEFCLSELFECARESMEKREARNCVILPSDIRSVFEFHPELHEFAKVGRVMFGGAPRVPLRLLHFQTWMLKYWRRHVKNWNIPIH